MEAEIKMKITAEGAKDDLHELTLKGTEEEMTLIRAMLSGMFWVSNEKGRLIKWRRYLSRTNPPSVPDPLLERIWPADDRRDYVLKEVGAVSSGEAAIYVHHISGYDGQRAYAARAEHLEEVGFACLRSKRMEDGKVWEVWYLPATFYAKGDLEGKSTDEIVQWLMQFIGPGNIEVVGRNWGLGVE